MWPGCQIVNAELAKQGGKLFGQRRMYSPRRHEVDLLVGACALRPWRSRRVALLNDVVSVSHVLVEEKLSVQGGGQVGGRVVEIHIRVPVASIERERRPSLGPHHQIRPGGMALQGEASTRLDDLGGHLRIVVPVASIGLDDFPRRMARTGHFQRLDCCTHAKHAIAIPDEQQRGGKDPARTAGTEWERTVRYNTMLTSPQEDRRAGDSDHVSHLQEPQVGRLRVAKVPREEGQRQRLGRSDGQRPGPEPSARVTGILAYRNRTARTGSFIPKMML